MSLTGIVTFGGNSKTAVAALLTMLVGKNMVLPLMFARQNMLDAIEKGMPHATTFHSLCMSAINKYINAFGVGRAQREDDVRDENDSLTMKTTNEMVSALLQQYFPHMQPGNKPHFMHELFLNTVARAVDLAMQLCFGLGGDAPVNDFSGWCEIFGSHGLDDDITQMWDENKIGDEASEKVVDILQCEAELNAGDDAMDTDEFDINCALIHYGVRLSMKVFAGIEDVFWHGTFEGKANLRFYDKDTRKFEHLETGTLTFTLAIYVTVRACPAKQHQHQQHQHQHHSMRNGLQPMRFGLNPCSCALSFPLAICRSSRISSLSAATSRT
jgi:hypothetical protein